MSDYFYRVNSPVHSAKYQRKTKQGLENESFQDFFLFRKNEKYRLLRQFSRSNSWDFPKPKKVPQKRFYFAILQHFAQRLFEHKEVILYHLFNQK